MATDVANAAAEVASIESAGAPSLPADTAAGPAAPSAEPLREDQIANAVAFLSNPKVAPASTEQKRSFLIKKGLTAPEIDEAFRRAPDAPAAAAAPAPALSQPNTGASPYAPPSQPSQQQAYLPAQQVYAQQPGTAQFQQPQQYPQQPGGQALTLPAQQLQVAGPPPGPRWTSVVLGLTAIAAGGYGLQRLVLPWLKEYYDRWAAARQGDRDGAAGGGKGAAKALTAEEHGTATVLADAIKAQTEEMKATMAALQAAVSELQAARKQEAAAPALDVAKLRSELRADVRSDLRAELRAFVDSINELSASAAPAAVASPVSSTYGTPQPSAASSPALSRGRKLDHDSYGMRNGDYSDVNGGTGANGILAHDDAPSFATPAGGRPAPGAHAQPAAAAGGSAWLSGGGSGPGAGRLPKPWERPQPQDDAPPAFAQQAAAPPPAPWQRQASPPPPQQQPSPPQRPGRAASVASSVSDAGADEVAAWRPPPVPQPSVPLPRRRSAAASPLPAPAAPASPPPQQQRPSPPPPPPQPQHNAAAVAAAEPLPGLPRMPPGPDPIPATPEQTVDSGTPPQSPPQNDTPASQDAAPVTPDVEAARAEREAQCPAASSGSAASVVSEAVAPQAPPSGAEPTSEITPAPTEQEEAVGAAEDFGV